jgi:plastocyanin
MSSTTSAARRLLALPLLVMALVACGADDDTGGTAAGAGDAAASGSEVVIKGFSFDPMEIEVASGTTVTWTNEDAAPHTIKDNSDLFPESDELAQGDTFSFTYDAPGEHPYVCGIHPYMKGTVTVS